MRKSSAAKRAASSPPAPARISTMTFLSSLGSLGRRRIFIVCSSSSILAFASLSSSFAISRSSSSLSVSSISRLSATVCWHALYSLYASTSGVRSLCSFMSFLKRVWFSTTEGLLSSAVKSSYLINKSSNF